jgi:hypothetical protein
VSAQEVDVSFDEQDAKATIARVNNTFFIFFNFYKIIDKYGGIVNKTIK